MRYKYTFANGDVMVFSHELSAVQEKAYTKVYGKVISIETYSVI